MTKNKILTTLNQALKVAILGLIDSLGNAELRDVLEGVPLGTHNNTSNGELGVKCIIIADRSSGDNPITLNSQILAASSSYTILADAKGFSVSFLTGTGTFNGAAVPAGFNESDPNVTAADIIITTDSDSTAYIRYNS